MRKTRPLASRAPKICVGLASWIWFSATEVAPGCTNCTVPSAEMLKLRQLSVALVEDCLTVSFEPDCDRVACPALTKPEVPKEPPVQALLVHGCGSVAASVTGMA